MLYVKIMSDEDLPDTDPFKHYTIVPVENSEVMRFAENTNLTDGTKLARINEPRFVLEVHAPEGGIQTHELFGNAYVMTESGKTIASHGALHK